MHLSAYTTGRLRGILPDGILQENYLLHQDGFGTFHHGPTCTRLRGMTSLRDVPVTELTSEFTCGCLSMSLGAPAEFRALVCHHQWNGCRELGLRALDEPQHLYEGWRRLHSILRIYSSDDLIIQDGGNEVLRTFLRTERAALVELEAELRQRFRTNGDYQRIQEFHARRRRLEEGTYLVGVGGLDMEDMARSRELALILLQAENLNLWSGSVLAELNEEMLSLLLLFSEDADHNESIEYVLLEESDTPAIQEIARALWDPSTLDLPTALGAARLV